MPRGRPKSISKEVLKDPRHPHNAEIRSYIESHPDSTFEEMRKALALPGLSSPWFLVIKGEVLRKKSGALFQMPSSLSRKPSAYMKIEIMESVDISSFTLELKEHYRSHILPMVKRLHPEGHSIHFAFLADPPCIEIRKMVG